MSEQRGYRRPSQSSYAKGDWWVANFAELLGGIAGFAIGFLVLVLVEMAAPRIDIGFLPLVTTLVGALGLRAVVKRPARRR